MTKLPFNTRIENEPFPLRFGWARYRFVRRGEGYAFSEYWPLVLDIEFGRAYRFAPEQDAVFKFSRSARLHLPWNLDALRNRHLEEFVLGFRLDGNEVKTDAYTLGSRRLVGTLNVFIQPEEEED